VGNYFNSTLTMTALTMISAFVLLWLFNKPSVRKIIITGIFIGASSFFYASSNNFLAFLKTGVANLPDSFLFNEPLAMHAILLMIILLIFASLKQHYQLNGLSGFRIKISPIYSRRAPRVLSCLFSRLFVGGQAKILIFTYCRFYFY